MEPVKYDDGKPRVDLLDPDVVLEIAHVLTFGAAKYADKNYLGLPQSRLYAAAMRHMLKFFGGEKLDPETGRSHLAHAGAGIFMMLEKELAATHDVRLAPAVTTEYEAITPPHLR